jgi:hypothetical protein
LGRSHALFLYSLYFPSRLFRLTLLPIFLDEALHIRWALLIAEGKKPWWRPWDWGRALGVWLDALLAPLAGDPLLIDRGLSVVFGAVTLWACFEIGRHLYDPRVGLVSALFYVFCPFTLVYDRLVLADPLLSTFGALTLLLSLRLVEAPTVRRGLLLGLTMALVVYTKITGVPLLGIPLATVLLLRPARVMVRPLLAAHALAFALVAYPLQLWAREGQVGLMVDMATHNDYASFRERLAVNLHLVAGWLSLYWTVPLIVLGLLGLGVSAARRYRPGLLLALLALLPILAFSACLTRGVPRYLLFTCVPFLVLAASAFCFLLDSLTGRLGLGTPARRALAGLLLLLAIAPALRLDYDLWTDPSRASLPPPERDQFISGWTSGYGVRDTVAFVRGELARHPAGITVVTHVTHVRTLRMTPLLLDLEFRNEPRVQLEDWDLSDPSALPAITAWAAARPTLLVVPRADPTSLPPPAESWAHLGSLVAQTFRPGGEVCDEIYRLCRGRQCGN